MPLGVFRRPFQIEDAQNLRNKLAHLHNGNVFANTSPGAISKLAKLGQYYDDLFPLERMSE